MVATRVVDRLGRADLHQDAMSDEEIADEAAEEIEVLLTQAVDQDLLEQFAKVILEAIQRSRQ